MLHATCFVKVEPFLTKGKSKALHEAGFGCTDGIFVILASCPTELNPSKLYAELGQRRGKAGIHGRKDRATTWRTYSSGKLGSTGRS